MSDSVARHHQHRDQHHAMLSAPQGRRTPRTPSRTHCHQIPTYGAVPRRPAPVCGFAVHSAGLTAYTSDDRHMITCQMSPHDDHYSGRKSIAAMATCFPSAELIAALHWITSPSVPLMSAWMWRQLRHLQRRERHQAACAGVSGNTVFTRERQARGVRR